MYVGEDFSSNLAVSTTMPPATPPQCEECRWCIGDSTTTTITPQPHQEECPSSSTSTLLASVLTAIITALLAGAIFLIVLVAVCKCHPNFRSEANKKV